MIRTKGEAGTGNVVEAVRHLKEIKRQIASLKEMSDSELSAFATEQRVTRDLVDRVKEMQRLPVVTFVAGGIATPADAALLMEMGAEGVFVGSGIFTSENPAKRAQAIVKATTYWQDPAVVAEVSEGLGEAMSGLEISQLETALANRGW